MAKLNGLKPKLAKLIIRLMQTKGMNATDLAKLSGLGGAKNVNGYLQGATSASAKLKIKKNKRGIKRMSTAVPFDRLFMYLELLGCDVDVRITLPKIDLMEELNEEPKPEPAPVIPKKPLDLKDMVH